MERADGDMTVTILGSGTCVPSLARSACAVLAAAGRSKLLLDCGPGTMRRLLEAGSGIHEITHLLLSHFHPDHSGELAPFLFASKYPDRRKRRHPLTLAAGKGFSDFFRRLEHLYGDWIDLGGQLNPIIEMDTAALDHRSFDDFQLSSAPVAHNPESLAYRLESRAGRTMVYSGDTGYSENLVQLAREADLLVCESALPDRLRVAGHMTPSLAGELAEKAGVGKLVLTHFYPECERADIFAECRRTYSGPLVLAEDLMVLAV